MSPQTLCSFLVPKIVSIISCLTKRTQKINLKFITSKGDDSEHFRDKLRCVITFYKSFTIFLIFNVENKKVYFYEIGKRFLLLFFTLLSIRKLFCFFINNRGEFMRVLRNSKEGYFNDKIMATAILVIILPLLSIRVKECSLKILKHKHKYTYFIMLPRYSPKKKIILIEKRVRIE